MNPTDNRIEFHDSIVRRIEQSRKAIEPYRVGRGRQAGLANALDTLLDELHERLDMAWRVLNTPAKESSVQQRIFYGQKAAELGLCYAAIARSYDELVGLSVIPGAERTEPTLAELAKQLERSEKPTTRRRRPVARSGAAT